MAYPNKIQRSYKMCWGQLAKSYILELVLKKGKGMRGNNLVKCVMNLYFAQVVKINLQSSNTSVLNKVIIFSSALAVIQVSL